MHFQIGDIVEIDFSNCSSISASIYSSIWDGLQFELIENKGGSWLGKITKTHGGSRYLVGDDINWGGIGKHLYLKLVTEKLQQQQRKYISPFTGKWV